MFRSEIWDKLPECIFGYFEITRVKREQYQNFQKSQVIFLKNCPNQTCGYWLITPIQQTVRSETNILTGNHKTTPSTVQC